ncbi:hypothetical protein ATO12_03075 [Aquimarina atlantica]|uniref:Glycosyltransferase (GlcNAc) n=1 Tax=Aquimarina atlantica TaxID=1317122 RepID=A0A023C0Q8_9FLAO|nr:GlcNAc-transferase family protein [Aquimarina atlantica]EZH75784.1 hypothetical protein ATO12_03075 [Aquimarina atlantica]
MLEKIYIQIPAYRDKELSNTVIDLNKKAKHAERLRIVIAWQHGKKEQLKKEVFDYGNVEIIDIHYKDSKGCNWARNLLQKQWKNEAYTLYLDSHHRFIKNWDEETIKMFKALKKNGVKKPIITAYLPSYDPENKPYGRMKYPLKIYPLERDKGLLTKLTSYPIPHWKKIKKPLNAQFISLHFLFADGFFNEEINFDPEIYFFGDEVLTSLRAYTYGYDLFHPHIILGWHLYDRKTRTPHWDDHTLWYKQEEVSYNKMKVIYTTNMTSNTILGPDRNLIEYEKYIDLKLYDNGIENEAICS